MGVPPPTSTSTNEKPGSLCRQPTPPLTLHRPSFSKGSAEPRAHSPFPSPFALHGSGAHLQRTCPRSAETRRPRDHRRHRRTYSLLCSLHSFNSAKVQFPPGAGAPGSAGAVQEPGAGSHTPPARREKRQAAGGAGERDAELCGAAGRTGPGRQCAFVYVARSAAANMHLKSARVSARQRPTVQSPSRRAPRTPGPRSLWYISDLTSRLGLILRWERFCVHLGSPLGWFLNFFFPKEV